MDVETETCQDWAKDIDTETPSRLSLISGGWVVDGGETLKIWLNSGQLQLELCLSLAKTVSGARGTF